MIYPRKIESTLADYLDTPDAIVLTGMRRVGKTTLLRKIYSEISSDNKVYLDLENPLNQAAFQETDFENIKNNLLALGVDVARPAYIFIDEIQAMPDIVQPIKYYIDHYKVKFFLTGSSHYYLKNLFPESLAGRKFIFELYPLDFQEFLWFKNENKSFATSFREMEKGKNQISYEKYKDLYDEYLRYGGFPQVVLASSPAEKERRLEDIFTSYFQKEITGLGGFTNLQSFKNMLRLLMQRVGSKVVPAKLAEELGISRPTVYSYLAFLEATYFISLLSPYSKSVDREVTGAKKLYLCDNGLLNHFAQVDSGRALENSIYNSLKTRGKIYYYERRSGGEVDFLLPEEKVALEVKSTASERDLQKLRELGNSLKYEAQYVISHNFVVEPGFIPVTEV